MPDDVFCSIEKEEHPLNMKSGKTLRRLIFSAVAMTMGFACVDPFDPSVSASEINILVVEGYINSGGGVTKITLSKVSPIYLGNRVLHETNAEVRIESEDHETFLLSEKAAGEYVSDTLALPTNKQYRLLIKRSNGIEYASEFLSVKVSPPIDSLHWEWRDQLYIYANAHDDESATQYYTWTFQEDWQNRGRYDQLIFYNGDTLIIRQPNDPGVVEYSICYSKSTSDEMILASTQNFVRDFISYPITTIPASSSKIEDIYRIIVRQRTMTEDEYNYVALANKNSELTGSFFDPMPSQLFGNVFRSDGQEEAIVGYVGTYTTQTLKLFIDGDDLPPHDSQEHCEFVEFQHSAYNLSLYFSDPTILLPHETYWKDGIPYVIAISAFCIDCALKPGYTSIKPVW